MPFCLLMRKALIAAVACVLAACSADDRREGPSGAGTDTVASQQPTPAASEICASDGGRAVLRRGNLEVLASESSGPGLLAYRREHGDDVVIVLINSADHGILVHRLDAGFCPTRGLSRCSPNPGMAMPLRIRMGA